MDLLNPYFLGQLRSRGAYGTEAIVSGEDGYVIRNHRPHAISLWSRVGEGMKSDQVHDPSISACSPLRHLSVARIFEQQIQDLTI
jgi:hypothetical protein